MPLKSPG